ncbi:MAG: DNA-directed DNA polymerase II small subunit [Candidatus Nanoarchaeia archaeon]|nr:DNA-directed DNA polymerase II small subunit [Candidatus Nanoarchaeia archaeon]
MKEVIKSFMDKKILLSPDVIENINEDNLDLIEELNEKNIIVLTNDLLNGDKEEKTEIKKDNRESIERKVKIVKSYEADPQKIEVKDFVSHFKSRYNKIKNILINRQDLQDVLSINKGIEKNNENISFIGLVFSKDLTKNGNIVIKLEDITGEITGIINQEKECFEIGKNLVLDEVIGVKGFIRNKVLFINNIYIPDTPYNKELKKSVDEVYAAFISDVHIGNKVFLKEEFEKFIEWINGELGDEKQKEISSKIKYLFLVGDLVDGIGIYPDQDKELIIPDIRGQYDLLADYLSKIRKDISLIICPGNHDAMRLSEPQPYLDKDLAKNVWALPNTFLVSNPALVNIHSSDDFSGFDVLMYHGNSLHYFIDNVDTLRFGNARDNASLAAKFLMQKRHLAPTHGSDVYMASKEDNLVIEEIPDFFVLGEMHRPDSTNYNGTTIINCSCWQGKTPYQEKMGNNPLPARVSIVNLKTREINIIKFDENDK